MNAEFEAKDINMNYEFSDNNHPQITSFTDDEGAAFDQHDLSAYELDAIELEGNYIPNAKSPNGNIVSGYDQVLACLLYTSPSPRDATLSRMPSSA